MSSSISNYYRRQREQAVSSGDSWPKDVQVSSLELADGEDPVLSLRVGVIISGRPAAIEAVDDGDGELSGVLRDQEAISEVAEIDAESLQTWANAVWWSARDAVFLAGLTRAERLVEELTDLLRAD